MMAAIFLLGAALFGIGLIRRIFGKALNHAEQGLWGLVVGWSLATGLGYGVARAGGSLNFQAGLVVLLFVWFAAIVFWLPTIKREISAGSERRGIVWQKSFTPLAILLGIFAPLFFYLFTTHMLQVGADGGIYSGGESSYYDMAYHAAVTTSFVHGANFPPVYTPMPPAPLLYPFLPDFLTALLIVLGMDLHSALVWTAVPLSLALIGIFYFFALRLTSFAGDFGETRSVRAAAIATLLFLLNGGIGFVCFFQDWRLSSKSLWQFLNTLDVNYTHLTSKGLVWPNVVTDMLLPQRTSIFGLAFGFIILSCFATTWTGQGRNKLIFAGVLAGLLPFFHVHTYVAVGLISGILFLLRPRREWLLFWLPAILLAFPRLYQFAGNLGTGGFARFQPGWRGQGESSWPVFWFRNVGLAAFLFIPAWLSASRPLRLFYIPFVALLCLALLVVLSPNDYDNLKLMTFWQAATSIMIAVWLFRIAHGGHGKIRFITVVVASVLSGVLAIVAESHSSKLMFGRDEVAAAEFVEANTTPHSLFLTAPSLHQPILSLAGRAVVRGPTAWLWSHGYPFAEREADVRAIYAGRDDALELLRYYRADYIYVSPRESDEFKVNRAFFDAAFPSVYRAANITIYDARGLRKGAVVTSPAFPPREYASRVDRDPAEILDQFPVVAYELYRLYKVAYARRPRYHEFMPDLRRLGRELYPGNPAWLETLKRNDRTLCDEWVERPDFRVRYGNMTSAQYVSALYANAGLPQSGREQSALSSALADGRETRATVLQRISADQRLFTREYNAAYVLCHYFGFLKRNPDEGPDHDLTGYNFWRQQLDRTRDYRGITRAFLESDEYKRRDP